MFNKFKNLKIVQKLKESSPKLRWLQFSQNQSKKTDEDYIKMLTSESDMQTISDEKKMEKMVREQLIKEFSPNIKNMQSYEYLVDSVMNTLKKKQNKATEIDKKIG